MIFYRRISTIVWVSLIVPALPSLYIERLMGKWNFVYTKCLIFCSDPQ